MFTFGKRVLSAILAMILCAGMVPAALADEAPAESAEIVKTAEAEEPVEAQEPTETEGEAEIQETAEVEEPEETATPAEAEELVESREPAGTEEPAETAEPTESGEPVGSEEQEELTSEEPASEEPSEEPALDGASSGSCGVGVTWSVSGGVLTIRGSGAMYDYEAPSMDWSSRGRWAPWYADHSGNITSVVVEKGVTSIGKNAFYDLSYVTQVSLPASVTAIGASAFERCGMWSMIIGSGETMTVELKEGLRTIGERAFANSSLRALELPASVTEIGEGFVLGCKELETIGVASRNAAFKTVDGGLLTKDGGEFIACPAKMTGRYAVPKSVTRIGPYAFYGCGALTGISLPDTVVHIDDFAFYGCIGLHELWMPSLLLELSDQALPSGGSLERLYLPQGLQHISCQVLSGSSAVGLHVYYGGSEAGWNAIQPTEAEVQRAYENTWGADEAYLARIRRPFADAAEFVFGVDGDPDEDGLPTRWELLGADTDGDGVIDVDLHAMGADAMEPDIFVEVDWMKGCEPDPTALEWVWRQFKAHGFQLHVDAGQDSIDHVTGKKWGDLSCGKEFAYQDVMNLDGSPQFTNWEAFVAKSFSNETGRDRVFRYCIFVNYFYVGGLVDATSASGNKYSNNGGLTYCKEGKPKQFFVVSLGVVSTYKDRYGNPANPTAAVAATFMHELGHSLGLRHGGNDGYNKKPNYISVMNYLFNTGLWGLTGWQAINYSDYEISGMDPNDIDEYDIFTFTDGKTPKGEETRLRYTLKGGSFFDLSLNNDAKDLNNTTGNAAYPPDEHHAKVPWLILGEDSDGNRMKLLPESQNDWENIDIKGGVNGLGAPGQSEDMEMEYDELSPVVLMKLIDERAPVFEDVPAVLRGDVNGDGLVNRADRVYLTRALADWPNYTVPAPEIGDLDDDGAVTRADRIELARTLMD